MREVLLTGVGCAEGGTKDEKDDEEEEEEEEEDDDDDDDEVKEGEGGVSGGVGASRGIGVSVE